MTADEVATLQIIPTFFKELFQLIVCNGKGRHSTL